jgi:hypothetical protein
MNSFFGDANYIPNTFMKILNENKNHLIDKTNWDEDLKNKAKEFFAAHPEQESELSSKWNKPKELSFENDIQPVIDKFNSTVTKSKNRRQTKKIVNKSHDLGDYIREKNKNDPKFNFDLKYSDDEFVIGFPLTWETCQYLDSYEDFGKGAKWCIGSTEDPEHWDQYIDAECVFLFIFAKNDRESALLTKEKELAEKKDGNEAQIGLFFNFEEHTNLKFMVQCENGSLTVWNEKDNAIGETEDIKQAIFHFCLGIYDHHDELWEESVRKRLNDKLLDDLLQTIDYYGRGLLRDMESIARETRKEEKIYSVFDEMIKKFVYEGINSYDCTNQEDYWKLSISSLWHNFIMKFKDPYGESYFDTTLFSIIYFIEQILELFEYKYNNQSKGFTKQDKLKLNAVQKLLTEEGQCYGKTDRYGTVEDFIKEIESNRKKTETLNENKNNLIDKTDWEDILKSRTKDFFTLHPEQEKKLGNKWNNPEKLSFKDDIQPIIDDFNNAITKSKIRKQTRKTVKESNDLGDYIRAKNRNDPKFDFDLVYSDDEFVIGFPLTWETCIYLNSSEDFGKGARWCIGKKDNSSYWDLHIKDHEVFIFFFTKYDFEIASIQEGKELSGDSIDFKKHSNKKYMIQCETPSYEPFTVWDENDSYIKSYEDIREAIFNSCLGISTYDRNRWVESIFNRLNDKFFTDLLKKIEYYTHSDNSLLDRNYKVIVEHEEKKLRSHYSEMINEFIYGDEQCETFWEKNIYFLWDKIIELKDDSFLGDSDFDKTYFNEIYFVEQFLESFFYIFSSSKD